jgi:hypothetical protein
MKTANVIPFLHDVSFDPDTTHLMGKAFDDVCNELQGTWQSDLVKSAIAKRIIQIVTKGERDPDQLCKRALQAVGLAEPKVAERRMSSKSRRRGLSVLTRSPLSGRI